MVRRNTNHVSALMVMFTKLKQRTVVQTLKRDNCEPSPTPVAESDIDWEWIVLKNTIEELFQYGRRHLSEKHVVLHVRVKKARVR